LHLDFEKGPIHPSPLGPSILTPAQDDQKEKFLAELVHMCSHETLPLQMGGDFNILRHSTEKNNDRFNDRWPFLFNTNIDGLNLREIEMSGRKYTWANNRISQTYEKLDRVLDTTEWEEKYPLTMVHALPRVISDYAPLLLNFGETSTSGSEHLFKFECEWLLKEYFIDMVREICSNYTWGGTPIERWQRKIRRIRQHHRWWAKNMSGQYRKENKQILNSLDMLDKKAKGDPLDSNEIGLKWYLNNRLAELLREEEIKWYQRASIGSQEFFSFSTRTK
jgi:hypothetical protein